MATFFNLLLLAICLLLAWRLVKTDAFVRRQQAELDRLIAERKAIFALLHELGEAFSDTIDKRELLRIVIACSVNISQARGGAAFEYDKNNHRLRAVAVTGVFPPLVPLTREMEDKLASRLDHLDHFTATEILDSESGILADALHFGAVLVSDAGADTRLPKFSEPALRFRSFMAVPLQYRDEIYGVLAVANRLDGDAFSKDSLDILQSIAVQAGYSLHNVRVYTQLAEKERLDHEIGVARDIQSILLPEDYPEIPGFAISAINIPARQVSGDYYDFIPLDDGRLGVVIADVSGKGVPASLIMTMCRTVLRSQALGKTSASEVLCDVNRLLYPDIREDMFITLSYLILDPARRTLNLARAGHESPLLFHNGSVRELRATGMAIGIDSGEVFESVVGDLAVELEPGDAIILYTDGITEALDEEEQEFGKERLKEAIQVSARDGANGILKNVVERLERFRGAAESGDDITLIALYVRNE